MLAFSRYHIPEIPQNHEAFALIVHAAEKYDLNPEEMIRTAICESSLSMHAVGRAGEIGAMQFMSKTFYKYAVLDKIGSPNIYDVSQQAEVAAYMFSIGEARQWTCWRNLYAHRNL